MIMMTKKKKKKKKKKKLLFKSTISARIENRHKPLYSFHTSTLVKK